jgi:hypothetical protein
VGIETDQATAETGTVAVVVVRDGEAGTESTDESDGETAKVITLAGASTHSEAACEPTAQEVMWEHFQRE